MCLPFYIDQFLPTLRQTPSSGTGMRRSHQIRRIPALSFCRRAVQQIDMRRCPTPNPQKYGPWCLAGACTRDKWVMVQPECLSNGKNQGRSARCLSGSTVLITRPRWNWTHARVIHLISGILHYACYAKFPKWHYYFTSRNYAAIHSRIIVWEKSEQPEHEQLMITTIVFFTLFFCVKYVENCCEDAFCTKIFAFCIIMHNFS